MMKHYRATSSIKVSRCIGHGMGTLYWVSPPISFPKPKKTTDEPEAEIERFRTALNQAKQELRAGVSECSPVCPKMSRPCSVSIA